MSANRLAAGFLIVIFLIGFSPVVWAEEPLNVENWPGDIPCNVLKKHPDGAYETTVAWNRFSQTHAPGTKYRNTRETSYWDQKSLFAGNFACRVGGASPDRGCP
jgi:hypothetical protein